MVDINFVKELNSQVTNAADFDVTADILKNINKDIDVNQDVDLEGNFANLFGDVEAMGEDTLTDMEFSIYTIANELSSMSVLAEAASHGTVPDGPEFTQIGVDVLGNGTLTGTLGGDLTFTHDDFDDWNPLQDLLTPDDITGGSPVPGTPDRDNPGQPGGGGAFPTNLGFDPIVLETDGGTTAGGLLEYTAAQEITYNFGVIDADVDDGTGNPVNVVDDLEIIIAEGTPFLVEDLGGGSAQLIIDAAAFQAGQVFLRFGDGVVDGDNLPQPFANGGAPQAVGDLDGLWALGAFEYENEFDAAGPIGDYAVNFVTAEGVITNPPPPVFA